MPFSWWYVFLYGYFYWFSSSSISSGLLEKLCNEIPVLLSVILLSITLPVTSVVFLTCSFEAVLSASVADSLAWSRNV